MSGGDAGPRPAGNLQDITIAPPGELLFKIADEGTLTYVAPQILDEAARALWNLCSDKVYLGYGDDAPYEAVDEPTKVYLRGAAREIMQPLALRLVRLDE